MFVFLYLHCDTRSFLTRLDLNSFGQVLIVQDQTDKLLYDFECTLYDDVFIYSFDLSISIRNLTTKKVIIDWGK